MAYLGLADSSRACGTINMPPLRGSAPLHRSNTPLLQPSFLLFHKNPTRCAKARERSPPGTVRYARDNWRPTLPNHEGRRVFPNAIPAISSRRRQPLELRRGMQGPSDLGGSYARSTSHLSRLTLRFSKPGSTVPAIEAFPSFKNFSDIGFGPGT